jgi:hypothetical protein
LQPKVTRGEHVHHCSSGTELMADAMWLPQPRQAFFAGVDRQYARAQRGRLDGLQQSGQVAPMHILDLCWGVGFGLCLSGIG